MHCSDTPLVPRVHHSPSDNMSVSLHRTSVAESKEPRSTSTFKIASRAQSELTMTHMRGTCGCLISVAVRIQANSTPALPAAVYLMLDTPHVRKAAMQTSALSRPACVHAPLAFIANLSNCCYIPASCADAVCCSLHCTGCPAAALHQVSCQLSSSNTTAPAAAASAPACCACRLLTQLTAPHMQAPPRLSFTNLQP